MVSPTTSPPLPTCPHREPEIEFLGRVASRFLRAMRIALGAAGIGFLAFAVHAVLDPSGLQSEQLAPPPLATRVAHQITWWCLGIPLLLPVRWLFGRGRWPMLLVGLLLWFGPMALAGDHSHGWLLRLFASFVACSVLLVWRTLFSLTRPAGDPPPAGP